VPNLEIKYLSEGSHFIQSNFQRTWISFSLASWISTYEDWIYIINKRWGYTRKRVLGDWYFELFKPLVLKQSYQVPSVLSLDHSSQA
jgi:hypothetical protein